MALAADLDCFAGASALAELAMRFAHADPHDDALDVLNGSLDQIASARPDSRPNSASPPPGATSPR